MNMMPSDFHVTCDEREPGSKSTVPISPQSINLIKDFRQTGRNLAPIASVKNKVSSEETLLLGEEVDSIHRLSSAVHAPVSFFKDKNQNIANEGCAAESLPEVRSLSMNVLAENTAPSESESSDSNINGQGLCSSECDADGFAQSSLTLDPNAHSCKLQQTQSCVISPTSPGQRAEQLPFELTQSDIVLRSCSKSRSDNSSLHTKATSLDQDLGASSRTVTADLHGLAESNLTLEQGSLRDIDSLPASELNLHRPRIAWASREAIPPAARNNDLTLLAESGISVGLRSPAGGEGEASPADDGDDAAVLRERGLMSDSGLDGSLSSGGTSPTSSMSVGEAPDEVLLQIFSLLTPPELCRHVTAVCKRWHCLAYDGSLWRRVSVAGWRASGAQLRRMVLRVPGAVRRLDIAGLESLALEDWESVAASCPELVSLDAGFVDDFNAAMLQAVLKACPKLSSLNVEGCRHANHEMMRVLTESAGARLQEFNFSHCSLTDESLLLLTKHIAGVTRLNIDGISWISDQVVRCLATTYVDSLESLELDGNDLSDLTLRHVSGCSRLKTLSISFCENLSDLAVKHMQGLQGLEKLVLRKGPGLSAQRLNDWFSSAGVSNITHLDLTECQQLSDQGVHSIARSCGASLKTLILAWCWDVTDVGMAAVPNFCLKLEKLNLTGLHRLEGGSWLFAAVDRMPLLTFISFEQCNVVEDTLIEEAVRCKPNLVILNYYGEVFMHARQHWEPQSLVHETQCQTGRIDPLLSQNLQTITFN